MLELLHPSFIVFFTKEWEIIWFFRVNIFFHFTPFSYNASSYSTSYMITKMTKFKIALDTSSFSRFPTVATEKVKTFFIKNSFHFSTSIISEENIRVPIDTDYMSPKLRLLIDAFHHSINIIAQKASDLSAFQSFIFIQFLASLAVPIPIG